jgi:UDP-N-acetylmuramyl pentapeptide phosphotransferase/UDP-N-acetylglucosamine-1-phosphate transferase
MLNVFSWYIAFVLFVAFLASSFLCYWIVKYAQHVWLDHPNERSLHTAPVPRLGGVAIWLGVVCAIGLLQQTLMDEVGAYLSIAAVLLLVTALLDDRHGLHPLLRLVAQMSAACLLVWGEHVYVSAAWLTWLWPLLGVVVLVWCINLYNFMDGMDGFAGAMAVIGFATLAVLGVMQTQTAFAVFCAVIATASAGFLCFNFPPARIFMGDSGSTVLGLMMGVLSIQGWQLHVYSLWVPVLLFSPFGVDATVTLCKRLCKREKVWLPHRQHYYQRWVLAGYSHRQVTGAYVILMLACAATAVIQQYAQQTWIDIGLPLAWLVCYGFLVLQSERSLQRRGQ